MAEQEKAEVVQAGSDDVKTVVHDTSAVRGGELRLKPQYIAPSTQGAEKRKAEAEPEEKATVDEEGKTEVTSARQKKGRGLNRNRQRYRPAPQYCKYHQDKGACDRKNCRCHHSLDEYLKVAPPDISADCPHMVEHGYCRYGWNCRFKTNHVNRETGNGKGCPVEEIPAENHGGISGETLSCIRKRKYEFKTRPIYSEIKALPGAMPEDGTPARTEHFELGLVGQRTYIKLLARDTPALDIRNKVTLGPMCTVGNLPFRALCSGLGADITFSEMILAENVIRGNRQDTSLAASHPSERCFGLQFAARFPDQAAEAAEVLTSAYSAAFIDVNAACPVELVTKRSMGSAIMAKPRLLTQTVAALAGTVACPVSTKLRMFTERDRSLTALDLVPLLRDAGCRTLWIHGRSSQQRYTKAADWGFVDRVGEAARPLGMHVGGCGDILTWADVQRTRETYGHVDGLMVARGALYKPWIFREIAEAREIDVSSTERLDYIRTFVRHGLLHWGSDSQGVETTRRFLLEWLSFACRYVPVGILDQVQTINSRAPAYIGRDDLETLMGSHRAADWIKLSEMVLGKVPDDYHFEPKHRSTTY